MGFQKCKILPNEKSICTQEIAPKVHLGWKSRELNWCNIYENFKFVIFIAVIQYHKKVQHF